jgi:hypothetical protein
MQEILTRALGQIAPTLIASLIQTIHPSSAMIANLARVEWHKKSKEMAEFWELLSLLSSSFWSWSIRWVVLRVVLHQGNTIVEYDKKADKHLRYTNSK